MQLDPEFSALVFGGMIERVRHEAGMVDWRQVITTAIVTVVLGGGAFYVSVQRDLAEIKTTITSRIAQREAQFQAIHDRDAQLADHIGELAAEDGRIRTDLLICRERVARLEAKSK